MNIEQSQCNNCTNNTSLYKIINITLPNCRCIPIIKHRMNQSSYKNFHKNNLSYINFLPENCQCNRQEEYKDFITRTLRNNIPILEFKGKIPEIPKHINNITWYFLACEDCANNRPWVKNYMANLSTCSYIDDHDSLVD